MGRTAFALACALAVAACDRAPLPASGAGAAPAVATDARPLIARVETLALVPTSDGAVLRATGIAPVQGYWDGALVPVATGDPTVLAFAFRAAPPAEPARISSPRSREVTVGLELTEADLAGIREIRVTGAEASRAVRR